MNNTLIKIFGIIAIVALLVTALAPVVYVLAPQLQEPVPVEVLSP